MTRAEKSRQILDAVALEGSVNKAAAVLGIARSTAQNRYAAANRAMIDNAAVVEPPAVVTRYLRRNSSSAQLELEALQAAAREEVERLKAEIAQGYTLPDVLTIGQQQASGYMLELSLPDAHVGKLAWGCETGYEDYDSRLAVQAFDTATATLLARAGGYAYDEIVLVVGNDLLHADTKNGTTTAGTPLDIDSRYHRNFVTVCEMITRSILAARKRTPRVRVVMIPGNHDTLSVWHLGHSLECLFKGDACVTIDNAPTMRKYLRHGKVMLMLTHGNTGKLSNYPLLMATEQPEMFGATEFREAHTGDKHQVHLQELHGVRVRILPALCPADSWHSEKHFVGNLRSAEAYIWHKDDGLVGTAVYTIKRGMAA